MGNNQNSSGQQTFRFLVLFMVAFFLMRSFFAPKTSNTPAPLRTVLTVEAAYKGVDTAEPPLFQKAEAEAELKNIATQIGGLEAKPQPSFWARFLAPSSADPKESDEYSYWARLRAGLLRQYVLKDAKGAVEMYNEVAQGSNFNTDATNRIKAQAIFQKGNLLWHTTKPGDIKRPDAIASIEMLVHRGRGALPFLDLNILVPNPAPSASSDEAAAVMTPTRFAPIRVRDLRGTIAQPNSEGLPDRVDTAYKDTPFHQIFDAIVKLFGSNPKWSYGLAILFFAVFLRLILQPLNKMQYASTRGMSAIAPDMKKIQDKYKDKPEMQMQAMKEIRALQKAHGVNPTTACGLGLVQLPIFFFVVYPLIQHYEAKMLLTNASFLWIKSLTLPDYPLLAAYAISQFLSFRLSSTPPADEMQARTQGLMSFIMPLTIPLFLKDYPSAFTLYWMMFNVLSTIFQYRMIKSYDPNHNFVKALMRSPFTATVEESIPSRPQTASESKALAKSTSQTQPKAFDNARGSLNSDKTNGKMNGKPNVLSKIAPLDLAQANEEELSEKSLGGNPSNSKKSGTRTSAARNRRRRRR